MLYDIYVGEVGMTDCSCVNYFRTSRGIGLSIPFSDFVFNLLGVSISSQKVCHILAVIYRLLYFITPINQYPAEINTKYVSTISNYIIESFIYVLMRCRLATNSSIFDGLYSSKGMKIIT